MQALRANYFISEEVYEDYLSHCTLRTSACAQAEQQIASDFRITGADYHNLYKECLHQVGDYPCIDHTGIDIFLNLPHVQEDLNINGKDKKWAFCNSTLGQTYDRDPEGPLHVYQTLLREEHNLKIVLLLLFSG